MARPSSAPNAEATARVYRLFAAYSVKDIVGENFRSHALLVDTATPTPRSGSIVISANVPVKSPPCHTTRRSAIAVRGIVPARNRKFDSPLEEAGFELRVPAREKRSFRAVLHGFPAIGPAPAPNPAEHRTLIAPGKRCRRIAGAHILAADADRPLINLAGGIRGSRERGARSTPPRGRIHRRRRCRRRVRATGAPFRRSCEHRPRRECASDRP